jgi:hypothetical protein
MAVYVFSALATQMARYDLQQFSLCIKKFYTIMLKEESFPDPHQSDVVPQHSTVSKEYSS